MTPDIQSSDEEIKWDNRFQRGVTVVPLAAFSILSKVPENTVLNSYGHDVTGPMITYFVWRVMGNFSAVFTAGAAMVFATGTELAQKAGYWQGTYDPQDFLAYTLGCTAAVLIDRAITKKESLEK